MNHETAERLKNSFHVSATSAPGAEGKYRITITAAELMNAVGPDGSTRAPRPAVVTVGTRPKISALEFEPPEQPTGISEQDYIEKAIEVIQGKLF